MLERSECVRQEQDQVLVSLKTALMGCFGAVSHITEIRNSKAVISPPPSEACADMDFTDEKNTSDEGWVFAIWRQSRGRIRKNLPRRKTETRLAWKCTEHAAVFKSCVRVIFFQPLFLGSKIP